jgi:hypothetical protein
MSDLTNYFVTVSLLDTGAARTETNLDLDPTCARGDKAPGAFLAQQAQDRYSVPQGGGLFRIEAESPEEAAQIAYDITNSYPEAMYCHDRYAHYVERYRDNHNRSVSVGDIVTVRSIGGPKLVLGVIGAGFVEVVDVLA